MRLRDSFRSSPLSGVPALVSAPVSPLHLRTWHSAADYRPGPERERGARHGAGPGHQPAEGDGGAKKKLRL